MVPEESKERSFEYFDHQDLDDSEQDYSRATNQLDNVAIRFEPVV